MKNYIDLPLEIKTILEKYCLEDKFSLQPQTLYNNIKGTLNTVSIKETSKIFEVSEYLVNKINEIK